MGAILFRQLLNAWRNRDNRPAEPDTHEEQPQEKPQRLDRGQSIVEYAIILTWLTLAFIGFIRGVGQATHGIWTTANSSLTTANTTAK
jgi:Flp pilus assembly pilin Flp